MIFTIPGEPEGKARPRVVRNQGKVHAFTPSKTRAYEERVRAAYIAAGGEHFGKQPIQIMITAWFGISESTSKAKRREMLKGKILPTKKPDTDNIAKLICDSLNGVAYDDDSQIVYMTVWKGYSEEPCVVVSIVSRI
jgi:Holliday junction resolvase RusA-like endonuclease